MKRFLKSKRAFAFFVAVAVCVLVVDTDLQERVMRQLMEDDELAKHDEHTKHDKLTEDDEVIRALITVDIGGGNCDIGHPTEDAKSAPDDAVKTLLASYPGSGKRFTWTVIKALTNMEVADDWNFSAKLDAKPLTIKTSWPHKEGIWSWGNQMDQVMLLIRNPRWALPSYHTMRFELDYAQDWSGSFLRIPNTYTERPTVDKWESWRDQYFEIEMNRWLNYIDFWMLGGFEEAKKETNFRCLSDMDCHPKAVIDFDHFYQENPTSEFVKITDILQTSASIEIIAAQARVCVLDAVYDRKDLHQGQRPFPDRIPQYRFTISQMETMLNLTTDLRDKFADVEYASNSVAKDLVQILDGYIRDIRAENSIESSIYLDDLLATFLSIADCESTAGVEYSVCTFMKDRSNHDIFFHEQHSDTFPYGEWLKDRAVLADLFYGHFPPQEGKWLSAKNHCTWEGVTCSDNRVTELALPNKSLTGSYPSDLTNLDQLSSLDLSDNPLTGSIPKEICDHSTDGTLSLTVTGDCGDVVA